MTFLRGVGLPDNLIDYLPSLLNQPIQFYSCFISYSSKDQAFAERLHADLQAKGVRCWFAPGGPEDRGPGCPRTINVAIRLRDKLLLILSQTSVASAWVLKWKCKPRFGRGARAARAGRCRSRSASIMP